MRAQKLNLRLGRALPTGYMGGAGEPGPPPEPGDFTLTLLTLPGDPTQSLSMSVTAGPGTVYWIIDTVAYPNTPEGAAAVIAGGGEASGSQAYTDVDINLGTIAASVSPGVYYVSAVAVVGSETSNVASDELTILPVKVTFIAATSVIEGTHDIPGDYQVGDMMVLFCSNPSSAAITDPSGWTPEVAMQSNGALRYRNFYKKIVADETTFTSANVRNSLVVLRNAESVLGAGVANNFGKSVVTPVQSVGSGADGGNDVSGEMFRIIWWMSLSARIEHMDEAQPNVTRRSFHPDSVVSASGHRHYIGTSEADAISAFTGTQYGSDASNSSRPVKVRTT